MNYKIITTTSKEQTENLVNEWTERGWVPAGGISVVSYTIGTEPRLEVNFYFSQALIKEK